MIQSFYYDFVKKFFPQYVTSVVEMLNGKNQAGLTYLHKSLLSPQFSPDGRFASILAEHTRAAADVVSLDSELPIMSRDALELTTGYLPKIGKKIALTEKEMKDVDTMIAQRQPVADIVGKIFNDTVKVTEAVYERNEDLFLSALSTGYALSTNNNGTGVRINYQFKETNKFATTKPWDAEDSTPIDDIQKLVDKSIHDMNTITDVYMDDTALNTLYKNRQVRNLYGFHQGVAVVSGANVPTLDLESLNSVFLRKWGISVHRVSRSIYTNINGQNMIHQPWAKGIMAFVCDRELGSLVWTTCAEATRPVAQVAYQTAERYILISKYAQNDPLKEFTASQAMVLPVLNNVHRIYLFDTQNAQA